MSLNLQMTNINKNKDKNYLINEIYNNNNNTAKYKLRYYFMYKQLK